MRQTEDSHAPMALPDDRLAAARACLNVDHERGLALSAEAFAHALATNDARAAAEAEAWAGRFLWTLGRVAEAETRLASACVRFEALEHAPGLARARLSLAQVRVAQGRLVDALAALLRVRPELERAGDGGGQVIALVSLAKIHEDLGDHAAAAEALVSALSKAEAAHRPMILNNLGAVHEALGHFEDALGVFEDARRAARAARDPRGEAYATMNVGLALHQLGRSRDALAALRDALDLAERIPVPDVAARVHVGFMLALAHLGEDGTERHFAAARDIAARLGAPELTATLGRARAEVHVRFGRAAQARAELEEVLALAREHALHDAARDALEWLSRACAAQGDFEAAWRSQRELQDAERQAARERHDLRVQALLVTHEAEAARRAAEAQRTLNVRLSRVNADLSRAVRDNAARLARAQRQAHFDDLTGLPNRALCAERLRSAVETAERDESAFAVLFIDLDGFKAVNDGLGHDAGDELLVRIARRLRRAIRRHDTLARLGGDEFLVVAEPINHPRDAAVVAHKLLAALRRPVSLRGRRVPIGASIGVSVFPNDGVDGAALQRRADEAMYRVKKSGKNGVGFASSPDPDEALATG